MFVLIEIPMATRSINVGGKEWRNSPIANGVCANVNGFPSHDMLRSTLITLHSYCCCFVPIDRNRMEAPLPFITIGRPCLAELL